MKIKKIKQPQLKNKGFSLVELTVTLAVFGVIVLITTQIIEQVNVKKNINIQKEHITAYENAVIKKINANYDDIYLLASKASNQQLVYTYANFNDYAKNGGNDIESNISHSFFNPCVLIKADTKRNTLSATLIYPANKPSLKNSAALSYELGNASWESSNKDLIGKVKTDYFTSQNMQALASSCNSKINSFKAGSIFIDLNNNNNLTSKKSNITDNSTNNGTNETLKNNSDSNLYNKSIGTNLYLDAIVKESTPWSNYFCDNGRAASQYQAEMIQVCNQHQLDTGKFLEHREQIDSIPGILQNDKCKYSVSAYFNSSSMVSGFGGLDSEQVALNERQINGINQGCVAADQYNSTSCYLEPIVADRLYPGHGCRHSYIYTCDIINESGIKTGENSVWQCAENIDGIHQMELQHCRLTAGPTDNGLHVDTNVCNGHTQADGYHKTWWKAAICKYSSDTYLEKCGDINPVAFLASGITPPQHKFKSVVLKSTKADWNGQYERMNVLVKSGTADGTSTESDTYLNVQKAGVKSGYVLLKSKGIQADSACKSSELGKMIQQQNESSNYTTSQLVCSYDLDFCGGSGYCYTPLVSQSQFVDKPSSYSISCPAGLRADVTGWSPTVANGGLSYDKCYSGTTPLNVSISQLKSGNKVTGLATICPTGGNGTPLNYLNRIKCVSSASEKILTGCKGGDNATCQ